MAGVGPPIAWTRLTIAAVVQGGGAAALTGRAVERGNPLHSKNDEFDLDIRLGVSDPAPQAAGLVPITYTSCEATYCGDSVIDACGTTIAGSNRRAKG